MVPAVKRGWLGAFLDWGYAWVNGLPSSERCNYTIESLLVPVGNDIKLAANLYRPTIADPLGTLLVRSPYGITPVAALGHTRFFAARGYQVLLCSCRGTSGSDGEMDMGANEVADGHAVVSWMRTQTWYTGSFATLGGSYLGFVQWALLTSPPADMKAAVITTGPHDMSDFIWDTGALYSNVITWADLTTHMKRGGGVLSFLLHMRSQTKRLAPVLDSTPLWNGVDKYFKTQFGADAPAWLREAMTCYDLTDPYWKPKQQGDALERADIPILLITGWYDILLRTVLEQYSRLEGRGCNVALTIGPWTHIGAQRGKTPAESLNWIEEHLTNQSERNRPFPVRVFITGTQKWRGLPKWPPPSSPHKLFLDHAKTLSENAPPPDTPDSKFQFDPAQPTPAIGAPLMYASEKGSSDENSKLAARSDVLTFSTEILDHGLEVCGKPSVELYHSTHLPHADLLVVLSEVEPTGMSHSISERYLRLDSRDNSQPIRLTLHDCAHQFRKGNKIQLLIAGGSHPRYIRNLGTGENPGTGSSLRPVWHTIRHNASALSSLVLPVSVPITGEALKVGEETINPSSD